MDHSIAAALTSGIEAIINRALHYDPATRQQLATLTDILAIESTAPALTLYCHGTAEGVRIMHYCEAPISTQLSGRPLALLTLLQKPSSLANSGVELVGNVALLQRWQMLLEQVDIDWEEALSQLLGDIAGPVTANTLRGGFGWTQQQAHDIQRLLKEYLPEEVRLVPSRPELEQFYRAVDELALKTDRITARIAQLQQALKDSMPKEKSS
jgi:ubiquinone biosynthesis protein UbiJ